MKNGRRIWPQLVEMVLGAALVALSGVLDWDPRWQAMGAALLVVALLHLLRALRYEKDADYRERYDTETGDERNAFLRQKAWTWAGVSFIMLSGVLTVVFLILKNDVWTKAAGMGGCLLMLLYWLFYLILQKKY